MLKPRSSPDSPLACALFEQETKVWARHNSNCSFLNRCLSHFPGIGHFWIRFWEPAVFSVGNFDCGWCNPMFVEEYRGWFTFPRASKFNAEVSVCCRSLLVVPFQRQVIWQAVGQGPPNIDPKFKGHAVPKARRQNRSIVKKVCALLTHANLFGILKLEPKIEIQVGSAARSISLHFVAYSPLPS